MNKTTQVDRFAIQAGKVVLTCILLLLCISIFLPGMHMDGVLYSAIARNMAAGTGSFWTPSFSETMLTNFNEHPPLALGLQSLFYLLLGDQLFIDKGFSFLCLLCSIYLISRLWFVTADDKNKGYFWLPCVFFSLMPRAMWAAGNNFFENSLSVLCLACCVLLLQYLKNRKFTYLLVASLLLLAALLTKGLVGLFPLALFAALTLSQKENLTFGDTIRESSRFAFTFLAITALFFLIFESARTNALRYFEIQLFPSLRGELVTGKRFEILRVLTQEILLPAIFLLPLFYLSGHKAFTKADDKRCVQNSALFLVLALCASLPIMVSPKQLEFYVLPSLPYFSLSLAFISLPAVKRLSTAVSTKKTLSMICYLLLCMASAFVVRLYHQNHAHVAARDSALAIAAMLPAKTTVTTEEALRDYWPLWAYAQRFRHINLDRSNELRTFHVTRAGAEVPKGYSRAAPRTGRFTLLQKLQD